MDLAGVVYGPVYTPTALCTDVFINELFLVSAGEDWVVCIIKFV